MTQLFTGILRDLCPRFLPAGRGTRIYELHSQRAQQSRTSTSDAFRRDRTGASVLVTSDVSARGVDYPGVTRVIQVGIPSSTEQYVHRVGRTGRAGTKGRGDMVLLPWEIGFVTWQLTEIPLKPLTVNELKSQVDDLATKYDSDPAAFLADACATRKEGKTRSLFKDKKYRFADVSEHLSVAPQFAKLDAAVVERMRKLDEEPIQETFASLLGYYIGKSPELRMHNKGAIVQGCKDWTTQAMGLPVPPYISAAFLQRMGISDGRTKHFGKERRTHEWRSTGPHWTGRGSVKARQAREGARGAPTWARDGLDENEDDVGLRQDFGGPKDKFRDRKVYGNGFGTSRRDTESGDGFGSGRRDREDNSGSGSGWRDREDNGGFEPRRRERGDSGSFGSGGRGRRSGSGGSSFGESGRSGGGFSGFDRNRSFGGRGGSERGGSGFGSRQR
jgi:ATP-dependent RNA helicase MSS116